MGDSWEEGGREGGVKTIKETPVEKMLRGVKDPIRQGEKKSNRGVGLRGPLNGER